MKTRLLLSFALFLTAQTVHAQGIGIGGGGGPAAPVPKKINFQGRVAVDNVNFEGSGQFKFALISTQTSNNPFIASSTTILWTNDGSHLNESVTQVATGEPDHYLTLSVAGGLYSVMLGDSTVFNNGVGTPIPMPALDPGLVLNIDGQPLTNLQLRVWFNDGTHGFQMLAPDQKLTSVVYAFRAAQAAAVDNNSITSDKIAFGAVTELKLANGAVTNGKIADFAITTEKINDAAITGIKLDAGSITESNLADGAVSAAKLGDGAVTKKKLGLGYAAGTLFDGVLTGVGGPMATFTKTFSTAMEHVPNITLSSDWSLDNASISGFSASRLPSTLILGSSSGKLSMMMLDGLPALLYKDDTTNKLKFVTAADASGTAWNTPIDTGAAPGDSDFEIALIADLPCIVYHYITTLSYAFPTNAARTTWATRAVTINFDQSGASLADVGGRPAIAYRQAGKLTYIRSAQSGAVPAVGFGNAPEITVDATSNTANSVALKVINGKPAIAYNVDGQALRFVRASDSTGSAWGAPIEIAGTGPANYKITMLIVNGRPAIACEDYSQNQLIYVRANDADGTSWPAAQVLVSSPTVSRVSMSIVNDKPAIAYNDGGSLKLLQATDTDGSAWGSPVTQPGHVTSTVALLGFGDGYSLAYKDGNFLKTTGQSLSWTASDGTVAPLIAASVQSAGVGTTQLANGSVTMDKLDSAVLNSLLPGPGAITTNMLANEAVTGSKIASNTITTQELGDSAVTSSKIASEAVTAQELAPGAVDTSRISDSAVTAAKLQNFAVTSLKIANNAVGASQIADHSITAAKLDPNALGALTFGAGSIHPSNISQNETFTFQALSTGVLTITGGADVAEPFPISANDTSLVPGEVLIIDEDHPGHLKRSEKVYDSRVAGIVSGAGGVKPGLTLRQHDVMEGSTQVALTGRVYVKADCSHGRIKPGDFLTTSAQAGHAARASDSLRSTGAVIGKAMTALDQGEGLVLVLVSLQ